MQLARPELRDELAKGVRVTASLSAAAVVGLLAVVSCPPPRVGGWPR